MPAVDSYSVASGMAIYGGRVAPPVGPAWLPAIGTVADISLNTLSSVQGASNASAIWSAWSGGAWAPWWGDLGSMAFEGGGHSNGYDNDVYRYDVATRSFSKIKNRTTNVHFIETTPGATYVADPVTGWMWADDGGVNLQEGQPFSAHFYANITAVPPSARAGATNGWLTAMGRIAMPLSGSSGTKRVHRLAMGEAQLWEMHGGGELAYQAGYGCSFYDAGRNRVVGFADSNKTFFTFADWTNDTVGTVSCPAVDAFYAVGAHFVADDVYMYIRQTSSALVFEMRDPVTGARSTPPVTGSGPGVGEHDGGWCWVESWRAWLYYPGGGNNFYTLKAPASSPRTGTWTWAKTVLTGTPYSIVESPPYTRLRCIPELNLVLWPSRPNNPMQGFGIAAP